MMRNEKGSVGAGLVIVMLVLIILGGFIGYVMNFVKVFKCDFQSPYKCEVIRVGGFFIPIVGAVAGWTHIPDGAETKVLK